MAALRILLRPEFFKKPFVSLSSSLGKNFKILGFIKHEGLMSVPVRSMGGHGRRMNILPTSYEEKDWRDHVHFYFLLGLIPLGIIIVGVNFFKGPATLADIPDGYEPKHWEYYKHPISQFLSKYIVDSPEKAHERHMHIMGKELERVKMRKLESKVAELQKLGLQESRAWYFEPHSERPTRVAREGAGSAEDAKGHPR